MNPMAFAKQMGAMAGEIAKTMELDAAAIVTVEGKNINFFFGSRYMTPDQMFKILKEVRSGLSTLIKEQKEGKLKLTLMSDDSTPDNPFKRN